jgi:two-component system response regulator CitB
MSAPLSVLIVEDVDMMRGLLSQVVSGIPGFKVSGAVRNGWDARIELTRRHPDVVLLDEVLPGESSHDLLNEMVQQGISVILVTGLEDPRHPLPVGALGRLSKPSWDTLSQDQARFGAAFKKFLLSTAP